MTNHHVIEGQVEIKVRFNSYDLDTLYQAKVVLSDSHNDLALLKLEGAESVAARAIPLSLTAPTLGQDVFTVGYPKSDIMGLKPKVTNGIVSALSGYRDDPRVIQTTVALQSGNSGGPLFNMKGEVVGVTSSSLLGFVSKDEGKGLDIPQNVNYAIKSAYVQALLSTLPNKGNYPEIQPKRLKLEDIIPRVIDSVLQVIVKVPES